VVPVDALFVEVKDVGIHVDPAAPQDDAERPDLLCPGLSLLVSPVLAGVGPRDECLWVMFKFGRDALGRRGTSCVRQYRHARALIDELHGAGEDGTNHFA